MKCMLFLLFCLLGYFGIDQMPEVYKVKMKLSNEKTKLTEDTVFLFKNYIENDSVFRVIVKGDTIPHPEIVRLVYEYRKGFIKGTNWPSYAYFFIDIYEKEEDCFVQFYCCIRGEAGNLECYKIKDGKIIAINTCPSIFDEFIPIEEYERGQYEGYND